jgi:GT2 family glycosyltransferase
MRDSPLRDGSPLGPRVLGFVACGAAVRREAFLAVGGFERRLGIGGEETLLSLDLAAAGWGLHYVEAAVAHHRPGVTGPRPGRDVTMLRNDLWTAWLRRPRTVALAATAHVAARARDRTARRALAAALREAPWALRNRRTLPDAIERDLRLLER